jgi:hypothetical protein
MLKIKLIALILLILVTNQSISAEWADVSRGEAKIKGMFVAQSIDVLSIKNYGSHIQYWERRKMTDSKDKLLNGTDLFDAAYHYYQITVNCNDLKSAKNYSKAVSENGITIYEKIEREIELKTHTPESSEYNLNYIACKISDGLAIPTENSDWAIFQNDNLEYAKDTLNKINGTVRFWIRKKHISSASYLQIDCAKKFVEKIGKTDNIGKLFLLHIFEKKQIYSINTDNEFIKYFCL